MSIGSCLLANELEGMGKEMLEMRINGDSWADIAKKYDLPNPSAARTKFTKLTGITDYKAKGQTLQMLANDAASKASKTGIFEAKKAVKKADKALKLDDPLSGLDNFQKIHLKDLENFYGKDSALYKEQLQVYQEKNAIQKAQEAAKLLDKEVAEVIKPIPHAGDLESKSKWKSTDQLVSDTGLTKSQVYEIMNMNDTGQGYLAIKNKLGIEFKQIDDVVWNGVLKKADGDLWKAYQAKVTSQSGFEAVEKAVWDLKKSGLSIDDIAKIDGMPPKNIVEAIIDGKWKLPPAGATKPFVPPAPPPPPAVFGVKAESGFQYKSDTEMKRWIREDTGQLSGAQTGAISNYTGSGSSTINNYLRKGSVPNYSGVEPGFEDNLIRRVKSLDAVMRPIPFDVKVTRYVDQAAFGGVDPEKLVGDVFRDKGFLSTSISQNGVFTNHNVRMEIDVPKGASARYVGDISIHKHEQELLLARNTPIKVNSVERHADGKWTLHGEVVV